MEATQTAQIAQMALNYCRLGATDAQLAEFFAVSPETLDGWLANDAAFAAAVRRGRKMADAEIVDSLHRLGTGFVETVEKVMICRGEPMVVTYRKQHPPHYKAGVTWLCNRLPQDWKLPGARRAEEAVAAQAVDFFTLPLLVDESVGVAEEKDEAIPVAARAEIIECPNHPVVPTGAPLDLARDKLHAERSNRRDEDARCRSAPQRVLAAAA